MGDGDEAKWSQADKLASLHPELRRHVRWIIHELQLEGWEPYVWYGWRSLRTQAKIRDAGNSWVSISFHNNVDDQGSPAALAVDLVDKRYAWGDDWDAVQQRNVPNAAKRERAEAFFARLGELAEERGLVWGGDWSPPQRDAAHVQLHANSKLGEVRRRVEEWLGGTDP